MNLFFTACGAVNESVTLKMSSISLSVYKYGTYVSFDAIVLGTKLV